jgi:hypothetical protein
MDDDTTLVAAGPCDTSSKINPLSSNVKIIRTNYNPELVFNKKFPLEGKDDKAISQWTNSHRKSAKSAPSCATVEELESKVRTNIFDKLDKC